MPHRNKDGRFVYRMPEPCDNCPFGTSDAGAFLRETLAEGRMAGIEAILRRGGTFICHKTTAASGKTEEDNLVCAGSINWQAERGIKADLVQVMERLEIVDQRQKAKRLMRNGEE